MRVVSVLNLILVLVLYLGACAPPPADLAPAGDRQDDRLLPRVPRPHATESDEAPGRWHLWAASPWVLDAVHDPWSGDAATAERWFFGSIADVEHDASGLWLALEQAGAIVTMSASLDVTATYTEVSAPTSLAAGEERIYVADDDLGLLAFERGQLGLGALMASSPTQAQALVATHLGLFAAVAQPQGGAAVVHFDVGLSVLGQWYSSAYARIEDIGYGPDGAIYIVDGGPCVFMFDNPEHIAGEVEPSRVFCRPGHAYHAVLPVEDSDGYLAHDEGIDVFREAATVEDSTPPAHVIQRDGWPGWNPRRLAHGWAH